MMLTMVQNLEVDIFADEIFLFGSIFAVLKNVYARSCWRLGTYQCHTASTHVSINSVHTYRKQVMQIC
jgi:hypothetical protein